MLFNSPEFVLGFLPVALAGFFLAGRSGGTPWALRWLVAASLFFYGWWNPKFVLLLAGSILANYGLAERIRRSGSRRWLSCGIAANLVLLGWFKYANFMIHDVLRLNTPELSIFLPLAISFFTFQQIMFLVESFRGDRVDRPPASLCRVRRILPAPDRRPDRAATRDHAATAGDRPGRAACGQYRGRIDDLPARHGEEGRAGRYLRALLGCRVRRRRTGRAAQLRRGVVRRGVLCAADLLRFLRLFRHGDRSRADAQRAVSAELRQPLQGSEHRRVLAPLAYHAEWLPARSRLHPAWRQPARRDAAPGQSDGDDAAGWPVARRGMELRAVGRTARSVSGRARTVPLEAARRPPVAR